LPDPLYLATAVESCCARVTFNWPGSSQGFRIDKKGSIDLVTEVESGM
jgi:hypothetical protein